MMKSPWTWALNPGKSPGPILRIGSAKSWRAGADSSTGGTSGVGGAWGYTMFFTQMEDVVYHKQMDEPLCNSLYAMFFSFCWGGQDPFTS